MCCTCLHGLEVSVVLHPAEMIATEQEMQAAGLEARDRDYCAHKFIDVKACKRENFPWTVACSHLLHEYEQCEFDE